MFRWADGGNLHEFWQMNKTPKLSASVVKDVVLQLRGLAGALNKLHDYRGGSCKSIFGAKFRFPLSYSLKSHKA
jgi:hypothetical protein